MIVDYYHFGDVVCFNTTFKTNNEERPLALFVGTNHHKQSIVFGVALLFDETTTSFEWLFETFIKAMGDKKSKTFLIDQCVAMTNALSSVLPETYHRLCVWHMFQNAVERLHHIFRNNVNFISAFKSCVYDCDNAKEFESTWNNMIV